MRFPVCLLVSLALSSCYSDHVIGGTESTAQQPSRTGPGCSAVGWPTAAGAYTRAVTHQGKERSYDLRLPEGYDPCKASPVLVLLRGEIGLLFDLDKDSLFLQQASAAGYVVVMPQATQVGVLAEWNAPLAPLAVRDVDDVGYIALVLGDIQKRDAARTYAIGSGSGATFTHTLAAQLPVFAGAVMVSGVLGGRRILSGELELPPTPVSPVSVLMMHGRDDAVIPFDGGVVDGRYFLGVSDAFAFWKEADGCVGTPTTVNLGPFSSRSFVCLENREVIAVGVQGVGHVLAKDATTVRVLALDILFKFLSRNTL